MTNVNERNVIYLTKRAGTQEDPFVDITETLFVQYGKAFLKEIPARDYDVIVKNDDGSYMIKTHTKENLTKQNNSFFVDYYEGIIYFSDSYDGMAKTFEYRGTGIILYPASRIYLNTIGDEGVIETFQSLADKGTNLVHKGEYNPLTSYMKGNIVSYKGISYMNTEESIGVEPKLGVNWQIISLRGEKGDKGDQGTQGLKGDKGDQGIQGIQGIQGEKGDTGERGLQGIQGLKGDKGDTGATGAQGIQGLQGVQGLQGDKGDIGLTGLKGDKGDKGDIGLQGIQGIQGERGLTGAQGIQGLKGDTGEQGIQGIQGEIGLTGAQGLKGDMGEKGDQGIQGLKGDKGDQGDVGAQGIQGVKGDKGDIGSVSNDWKNTFSSETNYYEGALVHYQGRVYIANLETVGNLPTNTTYWTLFVDKGADGIGNVISVNGKTGTIILTPDDILGVETTTGSQEKVDEALVSAKTYADDRVAEIISSAPETLDTLNELATALGNDPNFATTITNQIATKAHASDVSAHINDAVKHITPTERTVWNGKASTAVATTSANGLMSSEDKTKLDGVATGANNYIHPSTHPASIIVQDTANRFVTDVEKATWNAKASSALATTTTNGLMVSTDKTKLDGITNGANKILNHANNGSISVDGVEQVVYTHPASHPASIITQDASNRFVTDTEKANWNAKAGVTAVTTTTNGLMISTDKVKLDGIASGANNYVHPANHPASIITQDASNRFVTDSEKSAWNAKASTTAVTTTVNGLMISTDKAKLDGISTGANKTLNSATNGVITIDGVSQTVYTHPDSHPATMITQDANNRFMTDVERTKLNGIATGANNYVHPATHPASVIVQDATNRFVTDAEKAGWNAKETTTGSQAKVNAHKIEDAPHQYGNRFEWRYNVHTDSLDMVVLPK